MDDDDGATFGGDVMDDWARAREDRGLRSGPREREDGCDAVGGREGHSGKQTLLRQLERAREQRGSPPLWDAVVARLDAEERQRDVVAPMLRLLDQIRERVDDETWKLILDFEWRSSREIVSGVEVGLELGYDHGRAAALLEARRGPGDAATELTEKLADLLGDAEGEYLDVMLALVATLQATVMMARGEQRAGELGSVSLQG